LLLIAQHRNQRIVTLLLKPLRVIIRLVRLLANAFPNLPHLLALLGIEREFLGERRGVIGGGGNALRRARARRGRARSEKSRGRARAQAQQRQPDQENHYARVFHRLTFGERPSSIQSANFASASASCVVSSLACCWSGSARSVVATCSHGSAGAAATVVCRCVPPLFAAGSSISQAQLTISTDAATRPSVPPIRRIGRSASRSIASCTRLNSAGLRSSHECCARTCDAWRIICNCSVHCGHLRRCASTRRRSSAESSPSKN